MKTISVQIPVSSLAEAVADELRAGKRFQSRAALLATEIGMPGVTEAIDAVVAATDKLDNAQHTRGEIAAHNELFKASKQLRMAVRFARNVEKEPKQ